MSTKRLTGLVLAFAFMALIAASGAQAQTPAGTTIQNQASATFEDLAGNTYTATSNQVTTVVLPVYGVSIIPDDSGETPPVTPAMVQTAIPGQTLYYSYSLTNTGNDSDTYSIVPLLDGANSTMTLGIGDITVYHDQNGNGVLDGGEPAISSGGVPGNVGPIAAGGNVSLLVSYQVPGTAAAGEVAYVGIEGTSVGDGSEADTRNYHRTDVVSDASLTATMSGLPANVDPGAAITYTVTGSNVGSDDAHGVTVPSVGLTGVLIYDVIPVDPSTSNPLALAGSPSGAPAGGTVLYLPAGSSTAGSPETWAWSTTSAAGDIAVAYITSGDMTVGQNYNFTYDLNVPAAMPAGIINNSGAVAYVDNNPGTPDPTVVTTNNTQINVNVAADVLVGPDGAPGAGTPPNYDDDSQSVAQAWANSSVDFINTVRNDGNSADEINIILDPSSTVPAGWSVQFFRMDGVTPLNDSGTDGIVDVGSVNPGNTASFIVRVGVPGDAAAGGPYLAVVEAESANDPAVSNLTTDEITQVNPAAVDIGNYDGVPGVDDTPVNQNADPGQNVDFALDIVNTGGSSDNFSLSSAFPAGWTVTFYEDSNGNGVLDLPELTPITGIGPVAGGSEVQVIARVAVPGGEAPGVNNVTLRATSNNNGSIFDEITNTVTVNNASTVQIVPDRTGTGTANGTVRYDHTVTNTGNVDDTFMLSFVSSNGWSYAFFDTSNNPINSVTLTAGASEDIVVQISIPGGVSVGTVENGTITVTGNTYGATDSALDVTTIVAGNLVLAKSVNPGGDQLPGTELTYRTDYSNVGTASLDSIVIYDPVPNWTQYRVGSASSGTLAAGITGIAIEFSDDGGSTWTYTPASGGGGAPANYDANVTSVRWVLTGTLAGGVGTADGVSFVVRIIAE
ncbi:MAG: hypothetical protein GF417_09840 [Candidatus Latescibacteria bacterium]|nr:hypothetical protein [bacterium]MBD3424727.1 hypothetical protein [Candidatus Latescibacterota bacterium]